MQSWIKNLILNTELKNDDRHYIESSGRVEVREFLSRHQCYFQQAFGYIDLPLILKEALNFPSLTTKSWDYLGEFHTTCKEEAKALEYQPIKYLNKSKNLTEENLLFLRECASLATEPTLVSHHLLTLYTQHASLLSQQSYRTLLLIQLFKARSSSKNILQETIDSDPHAIAEKLTALAKTLETLAFQSGNEPDHELFLYATYVVFSAAQYYCSDSLPDGLRALQKRQWDQLDKQLSSLENGHEDEHNEDCVRLFRLHKLYCMTKTGLDNENLAEAFAHYFSLCAFSIPKNHPNFLMEMSAISQVQDQIKNLEGKDKDFLSNMALKISQAT